MCYKDILVYIDNGEASSVRLQTAIELALAHDAHLTGLYVLEPVVYPQYDTVYLPAAVIADQQRAAQDRAEQAAARFNSAVENAGCAATWRCAAGVVDRQINQHACYADLVVIGQSEARGPLVLDILVDDYVILGAPCPVLCVPLRGVGVGQAIGKRVLIAWNGSFEAARVLNGALALLAKADKVEVVAVNPPAALGDIATADACLHLARHGIRAAGDQLVGNGDGTVGERLLERVAERAIDLLVMGAYGHTRLREAILGGVTRHVLANMTVPVLMAH